MSAIKYCEVCGEPLSDHDKHVRFQLPERVLSSELQLETPGTWLSHSDASSSVMMQVPGISPYLRALLPVSLIGGHKVTFGVWVAVSPDDLHQAHATWFSEEYKDLQIEGSLANNIPPWAVLDAPVSLRVRDTNETPYCVSSTNATLEAILTREWPAQEVLVALPLV
jgi:hypothetical protein